MRPQNVVQSSDAPLAYRASLLDCACDVLDAGSISIRTTTAVVVPVALKLLQRYKSDDLFPHVTKLLVRCLRHMPPDAVTKEVLVQ